MSFVDHHCHSLRTDWTTFAPGAGEPATPTSAPGWRCCFTEGTRPEVLDRDVPYLLGYRHFLGALGELLEGGDVAAAASATSTDSGARTGTAGAYEEALGRARDRAIRRAGGQAYLRRLLDGAGTSALLVDTGFGGSGFVSLAELRRASGREVREVVRVEAVAEAVLGEGGPATRSLPDFVDAVRSRLATALDRDAVAVKSVLAYRAGLSLPDSGTLARRRAFTLLDRRRQAQRFDDPVLAPFLVRQATALAADRGVPLQVHTGLGDPDIDLPSADPALLRPLLHDPRTEGCAVVLLHCYPYVRAASYLAGAYPQVYMDLSLTVPLAEPVAGTLLREALALCPATKLLAGSDGHSYPEMHWWGAVVWRRALREVLDAEIAGRSLEEASATDLAGRILAGNARELYRLSPTAHSD